MEMLKISLQEYQARRAQIIENMPPSSIAVLHAAEAHFRNGDAEFSYRQQSNFYYLTGCCESQAALVLTKAKDGRGESLFFMKVTEPTEVIWTGARLGIEGALEHLGADKAYDITQLDTLLASWTADKKIIDIQQAIHALRVIKSPAERALMQKAAEISAEAHIRVMQASKPGLIEYELEAEFIYEVMRKGCRALAYPSIVGGGVNACTLHYNENDQVLRDGDLVLVDAGGEYQYYASDITRTFPVNGRFSEDQKAIYNLVLESQLAAIECIRPGIRWDTLQKKILKILVPGLVALGILKGEPAALIKEKAYRSVYMHSSGHWLGLDVHDVGDYLVNDTSRLLEPGMVLTVEPGIYIAPNTPNIDKRWWGIGVRIEDDILVTDIGHQVLSEAAPKTVEAIESLMAK